MKNIKGSYRTKDGKAQIEYELKYKEIYKPVFSASGNFDGGSGQNLATIAEAYPNDEMVQAIHEVWKTYHLNDMIPGCAHQRAENWGKEKIVFITGAKLDFDKIPKNWENIINDYCREIKYLSQLKKAIPEFFDKVNTDAKKGINYIPKDETVFSIPGRLKITDTILFKKGIISIITVKKLSGWVCWNEHQKGVLGKECPICGYVYGSAWQYMPIPDDVIETIKSWTEQAQPEENFYEYQAKEWLKKTKSELIIEFKEYDYYFPNDKEKRNIYNVTLKHEDETYTFTFGTSLNDTALNKQPSAYGILSSLACDIYVPDEFADFCLEFGYEMENIKQAKKTFNACMKQKQAMENMYTEDELQDLAEIR